jgi:ParB family chromosome partitioning protein
MAENAKKMITGETIVSLAAEFVDDSFVSDRIGDDGDYIELRDAIRDQGQFTPILVRPHPRVEGHYMVVFGHRRLRVARELGIPVRAVIKPLEDIAHIIAQGQENTARSDLSFIEKALFARKLLVMGQNKDTIKTALTIDDTVLSRMLSVAETVPLKVIEAVGAAKTVGRDRWENLKRLVMRPAGAERAEKIAGSGEFESKSGAERFDYLLSQLKVGRRSVRKQARETASASWASADKAVQARYRDTGRTFELSLTSNHASDFGEYISSNLESLYRAFKEMSARTKTGE